MSGAPRHLLRVTVLLDAATTAWVRAYVARHGFKASCANLGVSMVTLDEAREGGRMLESTAERLRAQARGGL